MSSHAEKNLFRHLIAPIQNTFNHLYGSLAAGIDDEDSDIDLAIVSPDPGRDRFKESLMLKKLTFGVDLDISPRPYSVEQYQKARQGDFLFDEIMPKRAKLPH